MKTGKRSRCQGPSVPKHSCNHGNLFPSCNLKGNHTFTTTAMTTGNAEGEADSGAKQKGEGEMEPSPDKEVKASGGVEGTYQPMEYIVHFVKVVKLYQQKNRSCFRCSSPKHLVQDCLKDISKSAWKADLNTKEGWQRMEAGLLRSLLSLSEHPWKRVPKHKDITKDSLP